MGSTRVGGKALERLLKFIGERRSGATALEEGFEAFEGEVHRRFAEAESELVGEELARLDVTLARLPLFGGRDERN